MVVIMGFKWTLALCLSWTMACSEAAGDDSSLKSWKSYDKSYANASLVDFSLLFSNYERYYSGVRMTAKAEVLDQIPHLCRLFKLLLLLLKPIVYKVQTFLGIMMINAMIFSRGSCAYTISPYNSKCVGKVTEAPRKMLIYIKDLFVTILTNVIA